MRKYSAGEQYEIGRVLDKVYDVMESTDNAISFEVSFLGVSLRSFNGKMIMDCPSQEYVINESTAYHKPFTEFDANRMIAELNVLSHFNKTDTTGEE